MQGKFLVHVKDNKIYHCNDGLISTHIIKPERKEYKNHSLNEFLTMKLAKECGLNICDLDFKITKDNVNYLLIKRYDRYFDIKNNDFERIHQEDMCQALSFLPEFKYGNAGKIDLYKIIFKIQSVVPITKKDNVTFELLNMIFFNYIVGNGDHHAKNISILFKKDEIKLAPFYDLCSSIILSKDIEQKMAFKIGNCYEFGKLRDSDLKIFFSNKVFDKKILDIYLTNILKLSNNILFNFEKVVKEYENLLTDKREFVNEYKNMIKTNIDSLLFALKKYKNSIIYKK
jgi:serine/threonine-protein kinase HipA